MVKKLVATVEKLVAHGRKTSRGGRIYISAIDKVEKLVADLDQGRYLLPVGPVT